MVHEPSPTGLLARLTDWRGKRGHTRVESGHNTGSVIGK